MHWFWKCILFLVFNYDIIGYLPLPIPCISVHLDQNMSEKYGNAFLTKNIKIVEIKSAWIVIFMEI